MNTCPECRTIIKNDADLKTIYHHYTTHDDIQLYIEELKTEKMENLQLVRELLNNTCKLKKMQQQLNSERAKNKRLIAKNGKLEKKLKDIDIEYKV